MTKKRILFPDLLRVLAAFFVVLIHVTSVGIHDEPAESGIWKLCMALNSVSRWSVPVFFMISGMFFLDPNHNLPIEKLFRKNIARVVLCIAGWGFFYSLLDQYLYGGLSLKSPLVAVYGILTDNTGYHLWFLYALLALYIATPTMRVFSAGACETQMRYALVIWFIFSVCFGEVNRMAAAFLGIEGFLPDGAVVIVGSAGYYLLGYYLCEYPISRKWSRRLYVLAAVCLCVTPVLNIGASRLGMNISFSDWMGIGSCVIAAVVFDFAARLREDALPLSFCRAVYWLSDRSFGIYLIHVFYVTLVFRIWKMTPFAAMPILGVLGSALVIYLLSALTAELLNRLPLLKKMV